MSLNCSRKAFTLVETVAALGLLATLLIAILATFSQEARLMARRTEQLAAIDIADGQIYEWNSSKGGIPVPARGTFAGRNDWRWETAYVKNHPSSQIGLQVVNFTIASTDPARQDRPLVSLQLFVATSLPNRESPSEAAP
jgi:type II secretory pathway pseudopilin PulG